MGNSFLALGARGPQGLLRMCGIAGFVSKGTIGAAEESIRKMTALVAHRGPDGDGHLLWNNVALGHRRLSIIDLSEAGHQPMEYASGRYAITFNGEIYNYIELRKELIEAGYPFGSETDTEVILAAYDFWGEDCLCRFNGMWAFAILDRHKATLFCARDRFGIKPFYYTNTRSVFAFGSEIKQLIQWLPQIRANRNVVIRFLSVSIPDVGKDTFFEGVQRLAPGHKLLMDTRTGSYSVDSFYHLRSTDVRGATSAELVSRFTDLFDESVGLRLRSDVRVGTCLSGGLDSSSIAVTAAALVRTSTNQPFGALTARSLDPAMDETEFARTVVEAAGLEWFTVSPTAEDANELNDELLWHQEEPVESGSQIMQYAVMRLARQNGIPVLLDGQGADETLLGYEWYHGVLAASHLQNGRLVRAARALLDVRRQGSPKDVLRALARTCEQFAPGVRSERYRRRTRYIENQPTLLPLLHNWRDALHDIREFQKAEINTMIIPSLLRYEDKNSMAFGVETRLPFLDYRLVELAIGLPVEAKIKNGWRKWILRQAMSNRMPQSITWRRGKIGFAAPDALWQKDRLSKVVQDILSSELILGLVNEPTLRRMLPIMPTRDRMRLHSVALWAKRFGVEAA